MIEYLHDAHFDWRDFECAGAATRTLLRKLAGDRAALNQLYDRLEVDPRLQAMCERHQLLDYVVLYDAPTGNFRLRLHVSTDERFDRPHDHRFSFSSYIMTGSYEHTWYRPVPDLYDNHREESVLGFQDRFNPDTVSRIDVADCVPYLSREERPGSCYSLHHQAIHTTVMAPDTVTLFLRGPAEKRRSVIMDLASGTLWWRFGQHEETRGRRDDKTMPADYIRQLRRRLTDLCVL
jgi:hypothetical protein